VSHTLICILYTDPFTFIIDFPYFDCKCSDSIEIWSFNKYWESLVFCVWSFKL